MVSGVFHVITMEGPPVLEDQILLLEEDVLSRQVPLYRNQLCTMYTSLLRKPFNQHRMTACCTVPITVFADNVHRQNFFFIQILIFQVICCFYWSTYYCHQNMLP